MATLTYAMLEDLHKGCSAISLKEYPTGGVTLDGLDFSAADQIYTLKDSFNIAQSDATVSEIKIDQGDDTIDVDIDKSDWTLSGNIPSVAQALLAYFYKKAKDVNATGIKGAGTDGVTYKGASFFTDPKEVMCSVLVESESKKTAICFARVRFIVGMAQDDNNNPAYLRCTGYVLTNTKDGEGDFAVLKAAE